MEKALNVSRWNDFELSNEDTISCFVVGESCNSDHKPCNGLKYSACRRGLCQCQDGFYEKDGICKAELGELVEEDAFCGSGSFKNNHCVCRNDEFYHPNMRACIKGEKKFYCSVVGDQTFSISAAAGINTPCTQPSQCSPFGVAFCPPAPPRCCSCHVYAKYNAINELCEVRNGLGGFCETTKDCKVENAACTPRNLCECKPNFVAQNESECKPSFAGECGATEDCAFENAECKVEMVNEKLPAKKCRCNDDFVKVDKTCLKKGLTRPR